MSKYTITLTYKHDVEIFKSDSLDKCNEFLSSISKTLKFEKLEMSYVLESQKHTYKVIDRESKTTLKIIPKELGTAMMFGLQSILMRNNKL